MPPCESVEIPWKGGGSREAPTAPAWDETQSPAPLPNSRLLSAEGSQTSVRTPRAARVTRTRASRSVLGGSIETERSAGYAPDPVNVGGSVAFRRAHRPAVVSVLAVREKR
jgi:hypothetical protein